VKWRHAETHSNALLESAGMMVPNSHVHRSSACTQMDLGMWYVLHGGVPMSSLSHPLASSTADSRGSRASIGQKPSQHHVHKSIRPVGATQSLWGPQIYAPENAHFSYHAGATISLKSPAISASVAASQHSAQPRQVRQARLHHQPASLHFQLFELNHRSCIEILSDRNVSRVTIRARRDVTERPRKH
jgi:hypothetical protein